MINCKCHLDLCSFLACLCICCVLTVLLSSCQTDIKTINLITSANKLPAESGKDVEIMYSDSGRVKMKLTGAVLNHFYGAKPYVEFPKGVQVYFYNDSLKVATVLKADYGIRHETDNKMEVKHNVEVVNVKGERLNTEYLTWDEEKGLIRTDDFVKITTANEVIYGDGLESNQNFTKYKINNIKGQLSLNED